MLEQARRFRRLWDAFGPGWLAYRLVYLVKARSGYLRRRTPAKSWSELPLGDHLSDPALAEPEAYLAHRLANAPRFFFAPSDRERFLPRFAQWDAGERTPRAVADQIAQGRLTYFSHAVAETGFPPNWHANPFTDQQAPDSRHWSRIGDFDHGDIKIIWEPNRFGFAFSLVRAYWRTSDETCAELFWQLVEDWRAHNPPMQGPNWKCGQEISFRIMAWCFGLYGFLNSRSTTAERVAVLTQMLAVSGQRIEANLSYALSQRNNHGISEGMGLWTLGVLFPELRQAAAWRETGRRVLENQGQELIYEDGSFVQHSVNYHRLMLHDYLWSLRLGDLHNSPFSAKLRDLVGRAGDWLYQIQDEGSGRVPCYGANDGALILPLSNCDYADFRPVVQATQYLQAGILSHGSGPWDEDLLWLFGPEALAAPQATQQRTDLNAEAGGYFTLRTPVSFVFTRCAGFRHRPSQADMLHVDLWWKGQNIALDAGTYSYNEPAPWNSPLAHTAFHNTVTVDGLDQMERAGRFLWLPWLHGQAFRTPASPKGHLAYWEGEHDGFQRLEQPVGHRRGLLRLGKDWWLILDALTSRGMHRYRLHWLLADAPHHWTVDAARMELDTLAGVYYVQMGALSTERRCSLVRAEDKGPRGWQAPYYLHREPALSMDMEVKADSTLLWTLFGPGPGDMTADEHALQVATQHWQAQIDWQLDAGYPLIRSVAMDGSLQDRLVIA